jgi:hypothetical protein
MSRILILSMPKAGTTILYYLIKKSMHRNTLCFFEPRHPVPKEAISSGHNNILTKVLYQHHRGKELYRPSVCSFYDKIILPARDPRDVLISHFMYSFIASPIIREVSKLNEMLTLLQKKEKYPDKVSFLELIALREQLESPHPEIPYYILKGGILKMFQFVVEVERLYTKNFFRFFYEDLIEQNIKPLEEFLQLKLFRNVRLPLKHKNVARSKSYGNWKHWFLNEDIDFFQPKLKNYMDWIGYGDDWELASNPKIEVSQSSAYLVKLAKRGTHKTTFLRKIAGYLKEKAYLKYKTN